MPFLRFSRDKRGYEHTYLLHASAKKGGPARLLYWYRTPPGVKVGRRPFDEPTRQALEEQYPSVAFDWPKLMDTPLPPPDVEHWRERRRVEKAARQARQASEREDREADAEAGGQEEQREASDDQQDAEGAGASAEATAHVENASSGPGDAAPDGGMTTPRVDGGARARKRRRRGGRRRRQGPAMDVLGSAGAATLSALPVVRAPETGADPDDSADAEDPDDSDAQDGSDSSE